MTVLCGAVYALCLLVAAGGFIFYGLTLIAARRRRVEAAVTKRFTPPITILKPLAGLEPDLEANLRTFFKQDYPEYQILFGVRSSDDAAASVAQKLIAQHPGRDASLVIAGDALYPNAKVSSLSRMMERARHEILIISDSDIRATPGYLQGIAADFADPQVGVSFCPYRAEPAPSWTPQNTRGSGPTFWSLLEALTLNTEFWCGVLVARMLEGIRFAVGPTMALRRKYLEELGGFAAVGDYLAEDFVLGQWAQRYGYRAVLSRHIVDHCIGSQPFWPNLQHRVRWARSTRRSRPWGYVGQIFTNPLPFALILLATRAAPLGLLVVAARAAVAAAIAGGLLRDRLARRYWWLIPLADVASLVVWILGFFGNTVQWRGRRYRVFRDGRFQPCNLPEA